MSKRAARRFRSPRASVYLEFAIVMPIVAMMLAAMTEFVALWDARVMANHAAFTVGRIASVDAGTENRDKTKLVSDQMKQATAVLMSTCSMGSLGGNGMVGASWYKTDITDPMDALTAAIQKPLAHCSYEIELTSLVEPDVLADVIGSFGSFQTGIFSQLFECINFAILKNVVMPVLECMSKNLNDVMFKKYTTFKNGGNAADVFGGDRQRRQIYDAKRRVDKYQAVQVWECSTGYKPEWCFTTSDPLDFPRAYDTSDYTLGCLQSGRWWVKSDHGWPIKGQQNMLDVTISWPVERTLLYRSLPTGLSEEGMELKHDEAVAAVGRAIFYPQPSIENGHLKSVGADAYTWTAPAIPGGDLDLLDQVMQDYLYFLRMLRFYYQYRLGEERYQTLGTRCSTTYWEQVRVYSWHISASNSSYTWRTIDEWYDWFIADGYSDVGAWDRINLLIQCGATYDGRWVTERHDTPRMIIAYDGTRYADGVLKEGNWGKPGLSHDLMETTDPPWDWACDNKSFGSKYNYELVVRGPSDLTECHEALLYEPAVGCTTYWDHLSYGRVDRYGYKARDQRTDRDKMEDFIGGGLGKHGESDWMSTTWAASVAASGDAFRFMAGPRRWTISDWDCESHLDGEWLCWSVDHDAATRHYRVQARRDDIAKWCFDGSWKGGVNVKKNEVAFSRTYVDDSASESEYAGRTNTVDFTYGVNDLTYDPLDTDTEAAGFVYLANSANLEPSSLGWCRPAVTNVNGYAYQRHDIVTNLMAIIDGWDSKIKRDVGFDSYTSEGKRKLCEGYYQQYYLPQAAGVSDAMCFSATHLIRAVDPTNAVGVLARENAAFENLVNILPAQKEADRVLSHDVIAILDAAIKKAEKSIASQDSAAGTINDTDATDEDVEDLAGLGEVPDEYANDPALMAEWMSRRVAEIKLEIFDLVQQLDAEALAIRRKQGAPDEKALGDPARGRREWLAERFRAIAQRRRQKMVHWASKTIACAILKDKVKWALTSLGPKLSVGAEAYKAETEDFCKLSVDCTDHFRKMADIHAKMLTYFAAATNTTSRSAVDTSTIEEADLPPDPDYPDVSTSASGSDNDYLGNGWKLDDGVWKRDGNLNIPGLDRQ